MAASSRNVGEGVREFRISPASDMAGVAGDHSSSLWALRFSKWRSRKETLLLLSSELQWIQIPAGGTCRHKLPDLRNTALRHVNEVTWTQVPILAKITRIQHLLQVEDMALRQVRRHTPEQHNLRMPRLLGKASGDGDRLVHGQIATELVLAGPGDFAGCQKIRLLKVFQRQRNLGIVQHY